MYIPARSPGRASRETQLRTIVHRVLKNARVQYALKKRGIRDGEAVVRRVAEHALDAEILKTAARRAVDEAIRKENKPTRIGGFYVR